MYTERSMADSLIENETDEDRISIKSTPSTSSLECFICMEKTHDPVLNIMDFELQRTCQCQANLHARCYIKWLRQSKVCPICRKELQLPPVQYVHSSVSVPVPLSIEEVTIDRLPNYPLQVNRCGLTLLTFMIAIIVFMGIFIIATIFILH